MSSLDWNRLSKLLEKLMIFYLHMHVNPITADSWEEIAWAALAFMYGEDRVDWKPRSHREVDIIVNLQGTKYNIGLKAGEITPVGGRRILTLSSFRLTKYDDLRDKLEDAYERNKSNHFYLICAREEQQERQRLIRYSVYKVDSKRLFPEEMRNKESWIPEPKEKPQAWVLKSDAATRLGFERVEIRRKMSDQLWYKIPVPNSILRLEELVSVNVPEKKSRKGPDRVP